VNSQNTAKYIQAEGDLNHARIMPSEQEWTDYLLDALAYEGHMYGIFEGNPLFLKETFKWSNE